MLPEFDESLFRWPSYMEAQSLLQTYFELASPTYHQILHRPTVEGWVTQLYDNGSIPEPCSHGKTAVLLSLFAQVTGYTTYSAPESPNGQVLSLSHTVHSPRKLIDPRLQYSQAAERQLSLQT